MNRSALFRRTIVGSIVRQRPILSALVGRAVKARYRGTVLGFAWTLLNPLVLMATYTAVFSIYMRLDLPNYPVFVFSGLVPWLWFSSSVQEGTQAIVFGSSLITRSRFSPEILPTVALLSSAVNFLLTLPLVIVWALAVGRPLGASLLVLPVIVALQALLSLGLVVMLSTWNVYFRDLQVIMGNLIQIAFFATPIVYPLAMVPERLRPWVRLNPWTLLAEAYQDVLYHGRMPSFSNLAAVAAVAVLLHCACELSFRRYRERLAEEL